MKFLRRDDQGRNVYSLDCPRCKAAGEIGMPESQVLARHECGVLFKQVINHHNGHELQVFIQDIIGDYHTMRAQAKRRRAMTKQQYEDLSLTLETAQRRLEDALECQTVETAQGKVRSALTEVEYSMKQLEDSRAKKPRKGLS